MEEAFLLTGKDWRSHVTIERQLMRPTDIRYNKVSPHNAVGALGWKVKTGMNDVIAKLFEAELNMIRDEIEH